MKVAPGVEMLELETVLPDGPTTIHPTVIWDEHDVILIDVGMPSQSPAIREQSEKAEAPFGSLNRVIITHQDLDHIAGLREVLDSASGEVEVIAHEAEAPYIQGDVVPIKMAKLEGLLRVVPEQKKRELEPLLRSMKSGYEHLHVTVDRTVKDGEVLPYCGGITVIHTPGHTPGHIALYLNASRALIAGDALFCESGRLLLPPEFVCADPVQAKESLKKLAAYDIRSVVCYHGGLATDDVNRRIAELAGRISL